MSMTTANNKANSSEAWKLDPHERMKNLTKYGNTVEIDPNQPIKRYFRSGMEMVRMANVYQTEGNFENAFILYIKFTTLFLEKIQTHPEYKTFDPAIKKQNKEKLKETFPIAEKLKAKLLERFQHEHNLYVEQEKQREQDRARDAARREKEKEKERETLLPPMAGGRPPTYDSVVMPVPSAPELLDQVMYPNDFPSGPNKSNLPSGGLLLPDSNKAVAPKPAFDRTLKPTSSSDSLMEGFLRQIIVPENTMSKFLALASKNTANNVETCGILAGRLAYNRLNITHVIVPKQQGTPDSCTTMNEEDIFEIQDQHNLITLGWIHTHPSQTAFLSSVDLHTHCSYQIMMPEAIAIVCAPKYQTTGFFCLTPGYGLDYIAQCRQSGFHPHPNDPPLFMDAAHVVIDDKLQIEVIDLRR